MKQKRRTKKKNVNKSKEWKPNVKQIKMVELLINPEDRRTKKDKCSEVGVTPKTLWEWMKNENFIDYMNKKLDSYTNAELPEVWRALLTQMKRGNVPAIELFCKLKGMIGDSRLKAKITQPGTGGDTVTEIEVTFDED